MRHNETKELLNVLMYEILEEKETLEVVAIVFANNLGEAKEKARKLGYCGESYRVEEAGEG